MNKKHLSLALTLLSLCATTTASDILWYRQPATKWMQALPIGNGRLGAMIFGGTAEERVALNESTLWSGQPNPDQDKPFGRERLDSLRQMYFDGKVKEGNDWAWNALNGNQTSFGTHLPLGNLFIRFPDINARRVTDYHRQLNLSSALATTSFKHKGVTYTREAFSSNPDEVLVYRFTANKRGHISFSLALNIENNLPTKLKVESSTLNFSGQAIFPMHGPGGVHFAGKVSVKAQGGKVSVKDGNLTVSNADEAQLVIDLRTDFERPQYKEELEREVTSALSQTHEALRSRHVSDYAPLYHRVSLSLGGSVVRDSVANIPTDERQRLADSGMDDPDFDALFFQMGRYLTIASSRSNSPLPIALQGFFNDNKACTMPWTNDYHLDINTEQNYWATGVGNLSDCDAPLFRWIASLVASGRRTAQTIYGCKGWTAHTTVNVWGYTAPSSCIAWGLHPTAASWIASHLWMHYEYTQDHDFLRTIAYPLLKGNAEFLLDYMTIDPRTGILVTGPSISPENAFAINGQHVSASMMPTCDRTFVYEVLNATLQSALILGVDASFADSLSHAISLLPEYKIGRDGGIMEWSEDWDQPNANHRHTSHLMGFWPYGQITLQRQPQLAAAVRRTFDLRLSAEGWEDTEWSRANAIGVYARLADAEEAYSSVKTLEGRLSRENLMTVSPGGIAGAENDIYAFDGNPAGTAGMAEMLLQTQNGALQLLPALPQAWSEGQFRGLCIRGGATVSAAWKDSKLLSASLTAIADNVFTIAVPSYGQFYATINGLPVLPRDGLWQVSLLKGQVLLISSNS
ncbi:MAG: glycoside hydrolase family 95 protein [Bacteroidaceae bacterium]|nr:glycoside hydrolase family 95 protein [Bacteroidaceae bacterium]